MRGRSLWALAGRLTPTGVVLIAATAAGTGCSRRDSGSLAALVGAAPFEALGGVHLGMPAAAFRRARPRAVPAAYGAYVEALDGGRMVYTFSGAVGGDSAPPVGHLRHVSFTRVTSGASTAWDMWARTVAAVGRHRSGEAPACARVAGYEGNSDGRAAVWRRDGVLVAVEASAQSAADSAAAVRGPAGVARPASVRVRIHRASVAPRLWTALLGGEAAGTPRGPIPAPGRAACRAGGEVAGGSDTQVPQPGA